MSEHAEHPEINYVKIWGILLVLLLVSLAGPELGIQWVTLVTAFGIAIVKAYIVCAYFMHLKFEKPMIPMLLIVSFALLCLMFIGIAPDVMKKEGQNWKSSIIVKGESSSHGNHAVEESHAH